MTVDSIRDAGPLEPAGFDALNRQRFGGRHASIHGIMRADAQDGANCQALRVLVVNGPHRAPDSERVELTRRLGHTVLQATDGFAALRVAVNYQPDVVLLDRDLTPFDSCQIARHLRFDFPRKDVWINVWIIAVIGRIDEERRNESTEAGIDVLLTEPLDPDVLATLLMLESGRVNRSARDAAANLACEEQFARSSSSIEH